MVIIEGPDGSGKTTLIERLGLERRQFKSMHAGVGANTPNGWAPNADPYQAYVEVMFNLAKQEGTVPHRLGIDRFHLSERVYGPILRAKQLVDDVTLENITGLLRDLRIPVILCLPPFSTTLTNVSTEGRDRPSYQTEGFLHQAYKGFEMVSPWATHVYDYTQNDLPVL